MLLLEFNPASSRLLFKEELESALLEVKEFSHYRWFHLGGNVVQSMMDIEQPHCVILPVPLSMLMFLLWRNKPISLLNLGMGGGSFERALSQYNDIAVTSVESEAKIIEMAHTYFSLPNTCDVIHDSAECFFQKNDKHYDVILCDLFFNEKNSFSLYQIEFYQELYCSLTNSGVSFINTHPESEADLIKLLQLSRKCFEHVALIEFDGYANVVMILSLDKLPSQNELRQNNSKDLLTLPGNFIKIIEKMHFLPVKEK